MAGADQLRPAKARWLGSMGLRCGETLRMLATHLDGKCNVRL